MPGEKFLKIGNNSNLTEAESVQTGGTGSRDKIPSLDSTGKLAANMMPDGLGADTLTLEASEALSAGNMVNFHVVGGNTRVRKADASSQTTRAHGFVKEAVAVGANATIYYSGANDDLSGFAAGDSIYLSETAGDVDNNPPTTSGSILQQVGFGIDTDEFSVRIEPPIVRA